MTPQPASYHRHRFPAEIISHAVWLYHVFSLSLRDVELILAERGVVVTHESIRHWCRNLVRTSPSGFADGDRGQVTCGTWMRCSSGLMARFITSGGLSISMASFSTFWSKADAAPLQPSVSS